MKISEEGFMISIPYATYLQMKTKIAELETKIESASLQDEMNDPVFGQFLAALLRKPGDLQFLEKSFSVRCYISESHLAGNKPQLYLKKMKDEYKESTRSV